MGTPIASTRVWHDGKAYDVSTIDRESSAAAAYGDVYAETIVWEIGPDGKRGVQAYHRGPGPPAWARRKNSQIICETLQKTWLSEYDLGMATLEQYMTDRLAQGRTRVNRCTPKHCIDHP